MPYTIKSTLRDYIVILIKPSLLIMLRWSGKRDSNSRPSRWQRDALPLSYSRIRVDKIYIIFKNLQ